MSSSEIEQAISLLSKLPTLGPRSARRAILFLLTKKETHFEPLITALQSVHDNIKTCPVCGNMDTQMPCSVCSDATRNKSLICVVQDVADLWALERAGAFKGVYHVLGGVLSALDGIGPDELEIVSLIQKVSAESVSEVILALPATMEGQTTAHYLSDRLAASGVKVSALSRGVPVGGELDYLDDGTLQMAFKARRAF
ncbi:MAG: recombination protein RecR [Alphaproteobacteria bacterium]|nr:recombination protein RecR [Alphaproteobacteria bacterium]